MQHISHNKIRPSRRVSRVGASMAIAAGLALGVAGVAGGGVAHAQNSGQPEAIKVCKHWDALGFKNRGECVKSFQQHHGNGYGGNGSGGNGQGDDNEDNGQSFGHYVEDTYTRVTKTVITAVSKTVTETVTHTIRAWWS